jgi:type I restriction-modification system DNA methylase subunit
MRNWIDILNESTTPEFYAWFGNSKVVDEAGEPLVVYHGTNQDFEAFCHKRLGTATGENAGASQGFFFTDHPDVALQYAHNAGMRISSNVAHFEAEQERLKKEVARLEKLAHRTNDWEPYEKAMMAWEELETDSMYEDPSVGQNVVEVYLSIQNPAYIEFNGTSVAGAGGDFDQMVRQAKADGRDGMILHNIKDSPKNDLVSNQYVIFRANQAKSVTNHGTYDAADDRLRH